MHFIVGGVDQGDAVDVTEFFGAAADSPAALGITLNQDLPHTKAPVDFILKDAAGLASVINGKGYNASQIMYDQGIMEGTAISSFDVVLVLRGDTNLDGTIAAEDAQNALMYYINWLANKGPKAAIESKVYLNNQDDPMAMLTKSHYAADASDGNGGISAEDAQTILMYYTNNLANKGYNWDQVVGTPTEPVPVIPKEELHSDPLKYDIRAKDEYLEYKNAQ
jgi:hypothetical protein